MSRASSSKAADLKGPGFRRSPAVRRADTRSKTAPAPKCSSSCRTQDHATWGECVRSKGLQLSPAVNDGYSTRQKSWDRELDNYESAVRQGLSPAGTKQHHVDAAIKEADA